MNQNISLAGITPLVVDPAILADDPHRAFSRLRAQHPVIQLGVGNYMALRADDVVALLSGPQTRQIDGCEYVEFIGIPDGAAARFLRDILVLDNGPSHRAKRGLFARTFAHAVIKNTRPHVRAVAHEIVKDLPRGDGFDFVEQVASPIPARVIASILGLPSAEAPYFANLVYKVALTLTLQYPIEKHDSIERATSELQTYLTKHMTARIDTPQDDMLSALVAEWRSFEVVSFECLVNQVLGLILGGSDTTRAGFATLVSLLLQHPEQWQAIQTDPSLIPGAVLEALRFDPSVGSITRVTTEPFEIGGVMLPTGTIVRASTMSAMRDPQFYADPDRFDIRRTDHPRLHTVFGLGPHRCLGEMLARIEMEESLSALIAVAPEIELQEAPRMIGFGGIRQITPMSVVIH